MQGITETCKAPVCDSGAEAFRPSPDRFERLGDHVAYRPKGLNNGSAARRQVVVTNAAAVHCGADLDGNGISVRRSDVGRGGGGVECGDEDGTGVYDGAIDPMGAVREELGVRLKGESSRDEGVSSVVGAESVEVEVRTRRALGRGEVVGLNFEFCQEEHKAGAVCFLVSFPF